MVSARFHWNPGALHFELRIQPSQEPEVLPGNRRQKIALSVWTIWSRNSRVAVFTQQCWNKAFGRSLFIHSLIHHFRNLTVWSEVCVYFTELFVSVSGVQHLGNGFICPNVDEAFHLLTAPSSLRTHLLIVVAIDGTPVLNAAGT